MTIMEIEERINYAIRYRELCLKYNDANHSNNMPPKKEMMTMFEKNAYVVKHYPKERIFIETYAIGKYSFQYYFEFPFNGSDPSILLYIKESETVWPVNRYSPGLKAIKKMFPQKDEREFAGYFLFTANLEQIDAALKDMKPLLDDLRKALTPYLEQDILDFTIS